MHTHAPLSPTQPNPFTSKIRCRSSSPLSHSGKGIETYALSHSKTCCTTSTPTQPSPQLSPIKHLPTIHNAIAIRSLPLTGRNLSNLHPDILSLVQREIQSNRISHQQSILYCHNGRHIIPQPKHLPLPWLNHVTEAHPYAEYVMLNKKTAFQRQLVGISHDKLNLEWIRLSQNQLEYKILSSIIDNLYISHPFQETLSTPHSASPTFKPGSSSPSDMPEGSDVPLPPLPLNKKRHIEAP